MPDEYSESFVFYRSFLDAIQEMEPGDQLETLMAICNYAIYGKEPVLTGVMPRAIFTIAKPSLDANKTKRSNGKKGGRPNKKTSGYQNKKPVVFENEKPNDTQNENQRFPKTKSTVTVTETETVTETVTDTVTDTETETKKSQSKRFVKPSLDEVKSYCSERKNRVDPQRFIDYYESNGWKIGGKTPMKDWKAAVRTWESRDKEKVGQHEPLDYGSPEDFYR